MTAANMITARVRFLAPTYNEHGQITHQPGEIIDGELLNQRQDFLFIRTTGGNYMRVDAGQDNLYDVVLQRIIG